MREFRRAVLVAAVFLLRTATALPSCDETFEFALNSAGQYYGRLKFENDLSGTYDLQVELSIPERTDEKLQIVRETSEDDIENGRNVVYNFSFPLKHRIVGNLPTLALVKFNNNEYCKSPPADGSFTLRDQNVFRGTTTPAATRPQSSWPQATSGQSAGAQSVPSTRPQATSGQTFRTQGGQSSRPQGGQSTWPHSTRGQSSWPQSTNDQSWRASLKQANTSGCGVRKEILSIQLILNGGPVKEGEFPWMVALFYYELGAFTYKCAGTLVSDRHVITAAHCINKAVDKMKIFAVLGRLNIKYWADESSVFRYVEKIIVHPEFVQVSDADVAVLVLDTSVKFSDLIRPACLWDEPVSLNDIYGEKGWIAGWGKNERGKLVDEPKQIILPIVKEATCLRSHPTFTSLTSERTFCAGERDGRIPCLGDSGSGFVMKRGGKWTLGGIVSAALSESTFCHGGHYAVFSDIPKYKTWLMKTLREN